MGEPAMIYVLTLFCAVVVVLAFSWRSMVWMPGKSARGLPSSLHSSESRVRDALRQDLIVLAQDIGERNVSQRFSQLIEAAEFIERSLQEAGYETCRQEVACEDKSVWNIDAERTGCRYPEEIVVIGAHYDTVPGSPGANDNGSAVVANLALARALAEIAPQRSVRFAFFVNEERPYYMTDAMGSLRYARQCRARGENIVGMIALETIGCYSDQPQSQRYPMAWLRHLYPTKGDFVAVVGNVRSRRPVHRFIRGFRTVQFPSEGMAALFGDFRLIGRLPAVHAPGEEVLMYRSPNRRSREHLEAFPAHVWMQVDINLWLTHDREHLLLVPTTTILMENLTRGA